MEIREDIDFCRKILSYIKVNFIHEKTPTYSVPALEKGLDILEVFASRRHPLTLSELAESLDRNANEIFRMVSCLAQRGYLTRDAESGSYRLSLRLFELAHANSPVQELIRSSHGPMRKLMEETGESCHLSILRGSDIIVLAQVETRQPIRISIEPGGRFPATQTASGKMLLAHLPEDELAQHSRTLPQQPAASKLLQKIRKDGYCLDLDATRRGVMDLAVLAGNPSVQAACAITITALRSESPGNFLKRTLAPLLATAEAITTASGFNL